LTEHAAQFGGKCYGILSVVGVLYMWVVPQPGPHLRECRIANSTDHGATWQQSDWAFRFEDGLTVPTFLNFGRDNAGSRDEFVYSYFIEPLWGPWTVVAYDDRWGQGHVEVSAFYWSFPAKWQGPDGRRATMVFTGKNSNDSWNTVEGTFVLRPTRQP
jgi:hypothetical protein